MSGGGGIDLGKLERELVGALAADRKYSRENDAKFRAVNQKVGTYEEFREIVNASHLNPLERKDLTDTTRKQPWNMVAHLGGGGGGHELVDPQTKHVVSSESPSNGQEFLRIWKKLKQKSQMDQYCFLLEVGGEGLHEVFKVEISMGLLGDILEVLKECFNVSDSNDVLCILSQLSRSPRFSLSVTFLSAKEKEAVTELFRKISLIGQTTCSISELAKLYSVDVPSAQTE